MAQLQLKSQAEGGRWKPFVTIGWETKKKRICTRKPKEELKAVYIDFKKQTDLCLFCLVPHHHQLDTGILQVGKRRPFYSILFAPPPDNLAQGH